MKNFIPHLREYGLSPQQWRVLRALYDASPLQESGLEMSTLSEQCFLLMPSLSRIAQNLEQRELILRKTSQSDQRKSILTLTESGKVLVKHMAPQSEARYARITKLFGYGKLELLYELLDELTNKLNTAEDGLGPDRDNDEQ